MFILPSKCVIEKFKVERRFLKCDYIGYSPAGASTINIPKSQIYIKLPS